MLKSTVDVITLLLKIGILDAQQGPLNIYLCNNGEDIMVFPSQKVLNSVNSGPCLCTIKSATQFYREAKVRNYQVLR